MLKALDIVFEMVARVNLSSQTFGYRELDVRISCRESDWQFGFLLRRLACSYDGYSTVLCCFTALATSAKGEAVVKRAPTNKYKL